MSDICNNINDVQKPNSSVLPKDSIELKEGNNIKIEVEDTGTKKIYTIGYVPFSLPEIFSSNDQAVTKVGITLPTVNFTGRIDSGSNDIVSRSMTPDKGLNLTSQFYWQETNVRGTSPGLWPQFSGAPTTVTVVDDEANEVSKQIGVEFRHLFYMGYSDKDVLAEADIKSLVNQDLLTSIKSKYSSFTYNYSVIPVYIYWVFPGDTAQITAAAEGPLPVPLNLTLPNIDITDEGITKSYRVIRTSAKTKFINATITIS